MISPNNAVVIHTYVAIKIHPVNMFLTFLVLQGYSASQIARCRSIVQFTRFIMAETRNYGSKYQKYSLGKCLDGTHILCHGRVATTQSTAYICTQEQRTNHKYKHKQNIFKLTRLCPIVIKYILDYACTWQNV